jgi:hypothetical protein
MPVHSPTLPSLCGAIHAVFVGVTTPADGGAAPRPCGRRRADGRGAWGLTVWFVIFGLASGGLPLGSPLVLLALADRGRESAHYLMLQ